jgi:hypothetical protein
MYKRTGQNNLKNRFYEMKKGVSSLATTSTTPNMLTANDLLILLSLRRKYKHNLDFNYRKKRKVIISGNS